jgi:hypothetical protein
MNITLNQDTRPYEETRNRISILVSTFNKFILANHQPGPEESQEILDQWKTFENKQAPKSPPAMPRPARQATGEARSPEGVPSQQNVQYLKMKAKEIIKGSLINIHKNSRAILGQ